MKVRVTINDRTTGVCLARQVVDSETTTAALLQVLGQFDGQFFNSYRAISAAAVCVDPGSGHEPSHVEAGSARSAA